MSIRFKSWYYVVSKSSPCGLVIRVVHAVNTLRTRAVTLPPSLTSTWQPQPERSGETRRCVLGERALPCPRLPGLRCGCEYLSRLAVRRYGCQRLRLGLRERNSAPRLLPKRSRRGDSCLVDRMLRTRAGDSCLVDHANVIWVLAPLSGRRALMPDVLSIRVLLS